MKKLYLIFFALLGAFLVFAAGFFIGRKSVNGVSLTLPERASSQSAPEAAQTAAAPARVVLPSSEKAPAEKTQTEKTQTAQTEAALPAEAPVPAKVNINTATAEELTSLPKIGPSRAESVIAYRTEHGSFSSVSEIMNVSGIGEGIFNEIKDLITVDEQ